MPVYYTLECSVDSVESAVNAINGGATRLEVCSGSIIGGITPDLCLFRKIRQMTSLPLHVLLRPRFGDFLYSDAEMCILRDNVRLFLDEGADGIVIGCLTPEGELDMKKMEDLICLSGNMTITLHRAFDVCKDAHSSLYDAKKLGIHVILTSGQKNTCYEGRQLLTSLVKEAGNDLDILMGAGVNADIIDKLIPETNGKHFHLSGKVTLSSAMTYRKENISMGFSLADEYMLWQTAKENIASAKAVLERYYG